MKIYFTPTTAGRSGGWLNGNLRHLDRFIQTELGKAGFHSSFDELWLTLSYPPLYVLPGVVGIEKGFMEYYDKLPYSRLDRKYKKINITIQAPEFSEHFDNKEKDNYNHRFNIADKFKNISETDLAKILIDKYLQAGELIVSKLKKDDNFDIDKFKTTLLTIKQNINDDFIKSVSGEQAVKLNDDTLTKAIELREKRKQTNKPKDQPIRDLRVYSNGLPDRALYPYANQYGEIFLNLLRRDKLMCPKYHHLYIQVAKTFDEGLKNSFAYEDWYVNGIAIIDYNNYQKQSEKEKQETIFNLIVEGLKDIATIDKLDTSIIDKVIAEIKVNGLDTELIYNIVESKTHILIISYFAKSNEEECPVFFRLTDKTTNKTNKIQIGKAMDIQIHMWLQKITLTSKQIKVKSSNSTKADVWLKDKVRAMEFNIADILS
jgi:hypothetical protein